MANHVNEFLEENLPAVSSLIAEKEEFSKTEVLNVVECLLLFFENQKPKEERLDNLPDRYNCYDCTGTGDVEQ